MLMIVKNLPCSVTANPKVHKQYKINILMRSTTIALIIIMSCPIDLITDIDCKSVNDKGTAEIGKKIRFNRASCEKYPVAHIDNRISDTKSKIFHVLIYLFKFQLLSAI